MDVLYGLLQRVHEGGAMWPQASASVTRNMSGTPSVRVRMGTRLYLLATQATSPVHDHRGSGCGILVLRGPDRDRIRDHQRWSHGQDGKP